MEAYQGYLELALAGVVGFVFKVVFGLIDKNAGISEKADRELHAEIKEVRREMKENVSLYRNNDRDLYGQTNALRADLKELQAIVNCIKGAK
jgi:hypothetical protein